MTVWSRVLCTQQSWPKTWKCSGGHEQRRTTSHPTPHSVSVQWLPELIDTGQNSQIGSSMYVIVNIIWFILILDDSIWTFYDIWIYLKYKNSIHLYPTFWICILGKTKPTWTYSLQQTGQVDGTLLKLFFVLHAFSMRLERVASREFWDFKALQPSALRHGPSQFHFAV